MKEDYQKSTKKLTLLFSNPVSFYEHYFEKRNRPGTSYQSFFRLLNIFRSFLSLIIQHHAIFDALLQKDFWFTSKNAIDLHTQALPLLEVFWRFPCKSKLASNVNPRWFWMGVSWNGFSLKISTMSKYKWPCRPVWLGQG